MEECFDCPSRITSKELAPLHSVKSGILQNACSTSPRMDADLEKSALMHIARLKNSLAKGPNTRQLCCVFPSSMLRESSDIRKPIRCVKFTKAVVRHADIRNQNPSLGMICRGEPHQRDPNPPKFEDRSQEETEWQEQGAREAAWKLAKNVFKLKEQERAAFFSPSENRCLPAPSNLKPEEREFVVDSGASMHIISKKDLNSAEMDTLTKSCSPTIVITANGEVQTHEEAIVYVKELDIILDYESPRKHASCERMWTDIEPGAQSNQAYPVAKRLNTLHRHGQLPREEDGAIEFWRLKDDLRNEFKNSQHRSDDMWKRTMAGGGGNKKRFQYCTDSSGQEILYLRALQGHSGRNPIDFTLQDNVLIPNNFFEYSYHIGCAINLHSITCSGLIA